MAGVGGVAIGLLALSGVTVPLASAGLLYTGLLLGGGLILVGGSLGVQTSGARELVQTGANMLYDLMKNTIADLAVAGLGNNYADKAWGLLGLHTNGQEVNKAFRGLPLSPGSRAGITVTPATRLTTTEAGGAATFTVVLNSAPTANVTIGLYSSDTTEGTVSTSRLTFTTKTWSRPQTVTVRGVDDYVADDDQDYYIVLGPAVGAANYSGIDPDDVPVTNTDDDGVGILVSPVAGLSTTEAGGRASFTVVLTSEPTDNVVIGVTSSDTTEGVVSTATLTFTPTNWSKAQKVTITGVDDTVQDGDQPYTIILGAAVSPGDFEYNGFNPTDVTVTNLDNDEPDPTDSIDGVYNAHGVWVDSVGTGPFDIQFFVINGFVFNDNFAFIGNVDAQGYFTGTAEYVAGYIFIPMTGTFSTTQSFLLSGSIPGVALTMTAQKVKVKGVDHALQDGNQTYAIVLGPAGNAGANAWRAA